MRRVFTFAFLVLSVFAMAQLPAYTWAARSQNCSAGDKTNAVVTDANGNVFTTGYFQGTIDMDAGPGVTTLTAGTYQNAFIAKYNTNGNLVWASVIHSTSQSEAYDIALDASGNILITGWFGGTIDFDPGAGVQSATGTGSASGFVAKYDPNGNYLWAFALPATYIISPMSVDLDLGGNVVVAGYLQGTTDFDPGPGTQLLSCVSTQRENVFLAKYSPAGNYLFAFNLSSAAGESAVLDMTITKAGSIAVCGYFMDSTDFDPGVGVQMRSSLPGGNNDAFIIQFDSLGNYEWDVTFGSAGSFLNGNDGAMGICSDPFNNIIVTGEMRGTVDFDPSPASQNLVTVGGTDIFLAKYSPTGAYLWAFRLGSPANDLGIRVCTDSSGAIFTTGSFTNGIDFDPGAGFNTLVSSGAGVADIYVASYKATGVFRFAFQLGDNSGGNSSAGICVQSSSLYVAGAFLGTVDFNPSTATANMSSSAGNADLFVARYDEGVTGIADEMSSGAGLHVYANSSTQQIEISMPGNSGKARIEIYNSDGAIVLSTETRSDAAVISAAGLATGAYYCRMTAENGTALTRSFVLTRQ